MAKTFTAGLLVAAGELSFFIKKYDGTEAFFQGKGGYPGLVYVAPSE